MSLPTATEIATALLQLHERAKSKQNPLPLLRMSAQQMREVSGRQQLRGTVLSSVEGILLRRHVYFFRNKDLYLIVPFGVLSAIPESKSVRET